jgi:hypothetical protein
VHSSYPHAEATIPHIQIKASGEGGGAVGPEDAVVARPGVARCVGAAKHGRPDLGPRGLGRAWAVGHSGVGSAVGLGWSTTDR